MPLPFRERNTIVKDLTRDHLTYRRLSIGLRRVEIVVAIVAFGGRLNVVSHSTVELPFVEISNGTELRVNS